MADKNALVRGLIGGILYDLMIKSNVYQIKVDENTTLADKLQEVVTALNGKVKTSDIVNDLTTGGLSVPLSAEMGKHLKYMIDNLPTGGGGDVPTHLSQFVNDAGFITTEADPTVPSWAKEPQKPAYTAEEIRLLDDESSPLLADKLQEIVNALNNKAPKFEMDDTLTLKDGVLSVQTADAAIEDDRRPIASGAVYEEFSKAVALLRTI